MSLDSICLSPEQGFELQKMRVMSDRMSDEQLKQMLNTTAAHMLIQDKLFRSMLNDAEVDGIPPIDLLEGLR